MGPPRRNMYHSSPQNMNQSSSPETPNSPLTHRSPVPVKQPNLGMTPASRYQHNLKVLRRRDPSIVSIFDQFSHVCVYHHNGTKWEKQGYEGSMFLYERDSYPPYGFYILNRMGSDDHIQRLYPEDSISASGSYLIIRSYPEFTHRRLAAASASQSKELSHQFSEVYAIPNVDHLTAAEKGEPKTIGLWMLATDSREPLIDIFTRLHSYIKKNQPYPQEFRYGPDRPPPSSTAAIGSASSHSNGIQTTQSCNNISTFRSNGESRPFQARQSPQTYSNGDTSDIDNLFAKIDNIPASHCALPSAPIQQTPNSISEMAIKSFLSTLGNQGVMPTADQPVLASTPRPSASPTPSVITGISLLDSIFASVKAPVSPTAQSTTQNTSTAPSMTFPSTSTHNFSPQVLNQEVISTLLGFPPPRAPSAASTTYSTGAQSHPSSREGDNEGDSDQLRESDGLSELSTVLNLNTARDENRSIGRRSLFAEQSPSTNGHLSVNGESVLGNVTPKASTTLSPPPARHTQSSYLLGHTPLTSHANEQPRSVSESHIQHSKPPLSEKLSSPASHSGRTSRPHVSFETNSELWPHPHSSNEVVSGDADGDDILELDFADTSALSDPDSFQRALNGFKRRSLDKQPPRVNGIDEKSPKKKGRKEKAAEQGSTGSTAKQLASPPNVAPPAVVVRLPQPIVVPDSPKQQQAHTPNGAAGLRATQSTPTPDGCRSEVVKDCLISGFTSQKSRATPILERNDFIREVLTLIHTDKAFVDTLYREYTSRVG